MDVHVIARSCELFLHYDSRASGCLFAFAEHPHEMGSKKGNVKRRRKIRRPQVIERMAPRAGLEPATLRLTGGTRSVSRPLPRCAGRCRFVRRALVKSCDFDPSPYATPCRRLLPFGASKGQRKGNVLRPGSLQLRCARTGVTVQREDVFEAGCGACSRRRQPMSFAIRRSKVGEMSRPAWKGTVAPRPCARRNCLWEPLCRTSAKPRPSRRQRPLEP